MENAMRLMLALILTVSSAALGGCGAIPEGGKTVREVYDDADGMPTAPGLAVSPVPEPGAPARTRPVIFPPKVFAVFVQEHLDLARDLKVGPHWVYFKLRDSSWTEQAIDREPVQSIPLEKGEELRPLKKALGGTLFSEALVPFQESAPLPRQKEKDEPRKDRRPDSLFMNGQKEVQR
jgi:hypothetical protein